MNTKLIAAILCVLMLLSIVPAAIFAEEAETAPATVEEPAVETAAEAPAAEAEAPTVEAEAPAVEAHAPAAEAEAPAAEAEAPAVEAEAPAAEAEETVVEEIAKPKAESKTYGAKYGQGSTYVVGKSDYGHFGAYGKQTDYTGILIDGKGITAFAAADANGDARVDLKPEYMCRLSTGKHTAQLIFTDGVSEIINFTVARETDPYGNPITGDSQNAVLWAVLAVLSLGGIAAGAVILKKEH